MCVYHSPTNFGTHKMCDSYIKKMCYKSKPILLLLSIKDTWSVYKFHFVDGQESYRKQD